MSSPEHLIPIVHSVDTESASDRIQHILCGGGKKLIVEISRYSRQATAYMENVEGEPRIEGATTALFTEGKRILEEEVARRGHALLFSLETGYPKMKGWLLTKGDELFGWLSQHETIDEGHLVVETVIGGHTPQDDEWL